MINILIMFSLIVKFLKFGFNDNYIKINGLFSWWDDEFNNKFFVVLEGVGYIVDCFNFDLKFLLDEIEIVKFNYLFDIKFK